MSEEANGRAKGGHARAAKLSSVERSEIARKAAVKRWSEATAEDDTPRVLESFKSKLHIAGAVIPSR